MNRNKTIADQMDILAWNEYCIKEYIYMPDIKDSRARLKALCEINPFVKFEPCKKCEGTGLSGVVCSTSREYAMIHGLGSAWDGGLCKECNGNGGKLISLNENLCTVCSDCDGVGLAKIYGYSTEKCYSCNGQGIKDWLKKVLG